jgi:hypothetical protein
MWLNNGDTLCLTKWVIHCFGEIFQREKEEGHRCSGACCLPPKGSLPSRVWWYLIGSSSISSSTLFLNCPQDPCQQHRKWP